MSAGAAPGISNDDLLDLPDLIALAVELSGKPIVVADPGSEHGRKLLATLGVEIEEN